MEEIQDLARRRMERIGSRCPHHISRTFSLCLSHRRCARSWHSRNNLYDIRRSLDIIKHSNTYFGLSLSKQSQKHGLERWHHINQYTQSQNKHRQLYSSIEHRTQFLTPARNTARTPTINRPTHNATPQSPQSHRIVAYPTACNIPSPPQPAISPLAAQPSAWPATDIHCLRQPPHIASFGHLCRKGVPTNGTECPHAPIGA